MSQTLAVVAPVEQLQLPDVQRPERTQSWPAWAASRIDLLRTDEQPDPKTGEWRLALTLPANWILTAGQREVLERHAKQLEALYQRTPAHDPDTEKEVLVALTEMMWVGSSSAQNEFSAEARGRAFLVALDDVPVWAVQAAIRHWDRGECGRNERGDLYDYRWCPAPAELRRMALAAMRPINERLRTVQMLLRAEARIEYSDEHRRKMCERLTALSLQLRTSLVGKDGSGGAVGGS